MKKTTVPIKGMHCRSCELLIEDELKNIPGVCKVDVSEKSGTAEIYYDSPHLSVDQIESAVNNAGYQIGLKETKPWFSRDLNDYADIFYAGVALFFLYILVNVLGLNKLLSVSGGNPTSLLTVLLIGLTAGVSTCMALIGGLVLGVSTKFAQNNPTADSLQKFTPHLWFNLGRIASYIFFGALIGIAGSFFQFSGFSLGLLTLAVALVMLTIGIQLTGLSPRLQNYKFTLPKNIFRLLSIKDTAQKTYSHNNALLLGASTFFLPCGFTQAMQLYAISTGSPVSGALIMGTFALGTAPGLLSIGGITSILKGLYAQKFFKFAGIIVITLSLFNANNALNLIGWNPAFIFAASSDILGAASEKSTLVGNTQIVRMTQDARGYTPNSFTITKGVPVRWIINSTDANTCASSLIASKIGVRKNLRSGENIIEFTPTDIGTIPFSCSMGMYRGSFTVVDKPQSLLPAAPTLQAVNTLPLGNSCSGGGCGCGGGARKPIDNQPVAAAEIQNNTQLIKTTYTQDNDINPNTFTVKANTPVTFAVDVKDNGYGCMSTIMVPGFTQAQFLEKGKTLTFSFTPTSPGEYPITCAMGVPRGKIKVI